MSYNMQAMDLIKIKSYYEWLITNHVYAEGESSWHKDLTEYIVSSIIDELNLDKDIVILDLGCGPGYFLDAMKERGYNKVVGVTLSKEDIELCESKGHTIQQFDLSFLPEQLGYHDQTVDFIFSRHALEHSPFPVITLMEYNRALKVDSQIYIEVPAPNNDRVHESNLNHYSILTDVMWKELLYRTGFEVTQNRVIEFDLNVGQDDEGNIKYAREKYYAIVAVKKKSLNTRLYLW